MRRRQSESNREDNLEKITDYGPEPFVTDIERATRLNTNFRTAIWTGTHLQTTLMSIVPGGEVGLEVHPGTDQLLYIVEGEGTAQMGANRERLNYQKNVRPGCAVFVPAGTWHNVVNAGGGPLKLFSAYAPPEHPHGTVHQTKEIADAEEHGRE